MNCTCHPYSLFDGQSARRHHHSAIIRSIEHLARLQGTLEEARATKEASPNPDMSQELLRRAFTALGALQFDLNELHDLYGEPQS